MTMPILMGCLGGGGSYRDVVLADSPYFFLGMDAASGTTETDLSPNGKNGTYLNSPTLAQTKIGNYGTYSVNHGYGTTAIATSPKTEIAKPTTFGGAMAVECWVNITSLTGNTDWAFLVSSDNYDLGLRNFFFAVNKNTNKFYLSVITTGGTFIVASTSTLSTGTDYHLVGVYNGTDIRAYLNGSLDCTPVSATGTIANANTPIWISSTDGAGYVRGFNGRIDNVSFYQSALSATKVLAHYNAGV